MRNIVSGRSAMYLIDADSGEVVTDAILAGEKVRIITQGEIERAKALEKETVSINGGRKFVKQFPDLSARLCERLSPNAVWVLYAILPFVGMNSGIIKFRSGAFLKRADITRRCTSAMSERTADRAISELCQAGVLAKCIIENRMAFIMNPFVMQNGSRANATLVSLFKDTEWANV